MEDDSMIITSDVVQNKGEVCDTSTPSYFCVPILSQGHNVLESTSEPSYQNTLDELGLCHTFLYYLLHMMILMPLNGICFVKTRVPMGHIGFLLTHFYIISFHLTLIIKWNIKLMNYCFVKLTSEL